MERNVLSLKNIYRFLMVNDYPTYSEGVIRERNRKGLTLVRFWQDTLLYEFRSGRYGQMIWRNTGSRNRYLSEICNRSERLRIYKEYMQEVLAVAEQEMVLAQIRQFMSMLTERQFSWDIFVKKLDVVLSCFADTDPYYTEEIAVYFQDHLKESKIYEDQGIEGELFFASWCLTFLMLHAVTGEYMASLEMQALRRRQELSPEGLWNCHCRQKGTKPDRVHIMTERCQKIGAVALPHSRFFGREEELFDLRERLVTGGRYLLTGIGGVGKTELLRQLLQQCCQDQLAEEVAVIRYDSSLAESMVAAFDIRRGKDLESNFQEALSRIRMCRNKKTVLFIDNIHHTMEEDPGLKELLDLPATIFVSSRLTELTGFETYVVQSPSLQAGMLIFRDNYGKNLTAEDRQCLHTILNTAMWRHTLTIRLFGRAARARGWSVMELKQQLEEKDLDFSWTEEVGIVRLQQTYRQLYSLSRLGRSKRELLRAFALLPYDVYSVGFVQQYLIGTVDVESTAKELDTLRVYGWLEENENGYAMHPIVAECMRGRNVREKELSPILKRILQTWQQEWQTDHPEDLYACEIGMYVRADLLQLARVTLHMIQFVEGRVTAELVRQALLANEILMESNTAQGCLTFLEKLMRRCPEADDAIWVTYRIIECATLLADPQMVETQMIQQEKARTVSEKLYLTFSLAYSKLLVRKGMLPRAEEMARRVIAGNMSAFRKAEASSHLAMAAKYQGDAEGFLLWSEKQVEYASQDDGSHYLCFALSNLCTTNVTLQRFVQAKEVLRQMEELIQKEGEDTLTNRMTYYLSKGITLMQTGEVPEGIRWLQQAKACAALYYGTKHLFYASICRELAVALNRGGHREEALANYQEALELYEVVHAGSFEIFLTNNNMGVLYLDWDRPEQGRKHLERAYDIVKDVGGQPVAEVTNNLVRACRMQGDTEEELAYLQIAAPLLTEVYGAEHPKAAAASKRLHQLQNGSERK